MIILAILVRLFLIEKKRMKFLNKKKCYLIKLQNGEDLFIRPDSYELGIFRSYHEFMLNINYYSYLKNLSEGIIVLVLIGSLYIIRLVNK